MKPVRALTILVIALVLSSFSTSGGLTGATQLQAIDCIDCSKQSRHPTDHSLQLDSGRYSHIANDGGQRYEEIGWQIQQVDSNYNGAGYSSLAVDKMGRPHISYTGVTGLLKYAWYDGNEWHVEMVDHESGQGSSLALDESERPHISYYAPTTYSIKYAWHDGANWHIETVDDYYSDETRTSLALDSSGQPHISYLPHFYDLLHGSEITFSKYAWRDEAGWHVDFVEVNLIVGGNASLALDELRHPHIAYYFGQDLRYAWHDGVNWQVETIANQVGWDSLSLILDKAGQPYIGYSGVGGAKYTWRDKTGWHFETVDSGGSSVSLALAPSGYLQMSYQHGNQLDYAWYDGASWHSELVKDGNLGPSTSLAIDDAGQTHISFHGDTGLNYALHPFSVNKQIMSTGDVHNNSILTFTLSLAGTGYDASLFDPLPSTIQYIPGSITTTLTPTPIYSDSIGTILWHGTLPTYTLSSISFQVVAGITGTGALSVPVPIVNIAWLTDTATGLSISSTATTRIKPLPLLLEKEVAPHANLRPGDVLTYTLTLSGSGQTVLLQDYLPPEVEYISDTATSMFTPTAIYSATNRVITWEGTLPVDAVQTIRFQVMLPDAVGGISEPVRPFTNTAWLTCTSGLEAGRVISSTVDSNVERRYFPVMMK